MKKFFECYPNTPWGKTSSVRSSDIRFLKAQEQATKPSVAVEVIAQHVNDFLQKIGMKPIENPIYSMNNIQMDGNTPKIDYKNIQKQFNLNSQSDIVWMKFTQDGYLGVVATSNDINFDYPASSDDYDKKTISGKWLHFTSGILIHKLNKKWDTSFVLLFPLANIPKPYTRSDIEKAIGNYLIEQNIPVIDFYSHNY